MLHQPNQNNQVDCSADLAIELRDWLVAGVKRGNIDDNVIGSLNQLISSQGTSAIDALAFLVHGHFYLVAAKDDPALIEFAETFVFRAIQALELATGRKLQEFAWD